MRRLIEKNFLLMLTVICCVAVLGLIACKPRTDDYSGKYVRETHDNESAEIVIRKLDNGKYHVTGLAFWGIKSPRGPNIGDLDFTTLVKEAKIHYTEYKRMREGKKEYYVLDITFNKRGLVAKEENALGVFGMNVFFEGEYIKK